jgi:hypothetical protein
MKSENKTNSFKEGLDVVKDHSGSMENDWSDLEQRLERYEKRKKTLLWTKILSGAAAILLLMLAWWLSQPKEVIQPAQDIVKHKPLPQKGTGKAENEINPPVNGNGVLKDSKPAEDVKVLPQKQQQYSFEEQNKIVVEIAPLPALSVLDSLSAFDSKIDEQKVVIKLDSLRPAFPQVPSEDTKIEALNKPKPTKLTLSIIYAPALNGVNNFSNAKVGNDVGLLLTVGLTKNLSVTTGAIYAKKLYESDFKDYNPAYKPALTYDPQSVYADCRVLDIPLNINYSLIKKGKNSFSVGTGISSYLMLKEDYRYVYSNSYNNPPYTYSISNQNKHWFGILNLEARYQRQLNPKFGLGLQPYMKIPLNDIGYGNVKLQSLGMAVNFNWNISKSSKKDN